MTKKRRALEALAWLLGTGFVIGHSYSGQSPVLYGIACYIIGLFIAARVGDLLGYRAPEPEGDSHDGRP